MLLPSLSLFLSSSSNKLPKADLATVSPNNGGVNKLPSARWHDAVFERTTETARTLMVVNL